jgi:hypothetical protein
MINSSQQQREILKLQNEYNEALRVSQSIAGAIVQDLEDQINNTNDISNATKKYIQNLQSSVKNLEDSEDVQKQIIKNNKEINNLQRGITDANRKDVEARVAALQLTNEALQFDLKRLDIIQKVDDATKELAGSMGDAFDGLVDTFDNIPLVGGMLSKLGKMGSSVFKEQLGVAAKQFTTNFASNLGQGQGVITALRGAMGGLSTGAAATAIAIGAVLIVVAAVVATIALAIKRFSELDQAAKAFREETGLLVSQTRGMQQNIRNTNVDFANLGVSAENAAKAAAEFTNAFDGLQQPSEAVMGSILVLNKNFGVSITEATKLNKVFQNIGDLTAEQSQALIGQTVEMAKMAGVSPDKVIKDMADNSEYAYKYFGGSAEELRNAAVEAAKLGTSIGEAGKVADNLLDFEKSISSELEASAMLGQNLNFSRARQLAATGETLDAQQAVVDEVMKLGDLTKLNSFEQEKLAEASNMTMESLVTQQRIRERFGVLDKEQLAAAQALAASGKDISQMTQADLKAQTDKLAKQQEMQSVTDALKNEVSSLGTGFMDMMAPLGSTIMNNLLDQMKNMGVIVRPIMKFFGALMSIIFGVLGAMNDIFQAVVGPIYAIGGAILEMLIQPIQRVVERLQPLFDKFKELKAKTMEAVEPIMEIFRALGDLFAEQVDAGPMGYFIDFMVWGLGKIFEVIGFIAEGLAFVLNPVVDFITFLMEGIQSISSIIDEYLIQPLVKAGDLLNTVSFGALGTATPAPTSESGESINDGVVQNGQVVSTHPDDFLIATKNPAGLADSLGGGGGTPMVSMEGVITELRELKAAFLANKDVYMDSAKVTSIVRKKTETSTDNKFGTQFA